MKQRLAVGLLVLVLAVAFAASADALTTASTGGPDPLARVWSEWPSEVSCGGPPFDPVAAFSGSTGVENGSLGSEKALRKFLARGILASVGARRHNWRLIVESKGVAEFTNGRLSMNSDSEHWPGLQIMRFVRGRDRWKWSGYGSNCTPRSVRDGRTAITWTLARGQHLGPETQQIEVNLGPGECDNGTSQNKRLETPEFREQNGALLMSLWLRPYVYPKGTNGATCEALIEPPVKIELPESLGGRRLLDGGTYPPSLPREPR